MYKNVVAGILGSNNPFVQDVIQDCCITLLTQIRNGRIDVENITLNNKINTVYFRSLVYRRAIDWTRVKRNKMACKSEFPLLGEDPDDLVLIEIIDSCPVEDIEHIKDKLITFESENISNNFHAKIFRYYFFQGISIYKLSLGTDISRAILTESKKLMQLKVTQWLKEKHKKQNQRSAVKMLA
jgi:hypothetical protein